MWRTLAQSGLKSDDETTFAGLYHGRQGPAAGHVQYFGMWGDNPKAGLNSTKTFTNLHLPYLLFAQYV